MSSPREGGGECEAENVKFGPRLVTMRSPRVVPAVEMIRPVATGPSGRGTVSVDAACVAGDGAGGRRRGCWGGAVERRCGAPGEQNREHQPRTHDQYATHAHDPRPRSDAGVCT